MTKLVLNSKSDLLAFIKSELNKGNLTMGGISTLCGVDKGGLSKALNSSVDLVPHPLARKLTEQGFEGVDLVEKGFDAKATWLTIEYYAYESKAKAEGAKQIARTFGMLGVMETFDQLENSKGKQILPEPVTNEMYLRACDRLASIENLKLPAHTRQAMIDGLTNRFLNTDQKALPESERYYGVAQRAEQLGYRTLSIGERSSLGKYVANKNKSRQVPLDCIKDDRLVNGRIDKINCYKICEELDSYIKAWFAERDKPKHIQTNFFDFFK